MELIPLHRDLRKINHGLTLKRKDNNKGYEPGNVIWALPEVQVRNTRRNVPLTFQGRTMILKDWA